MQILVEDVSFLPNKAVDIKGTRQGLVILLDANRDFEDIKAGLKNKMESARGFFTGAKFTLHGEKTLFPAEINELEAICKAYGLIPNPDARWPLEQLPQATPGTANKKTALPGEPALLVKRTLRSGQIAAHHGHVTVLGDVHPGARVVAGGNVIIFGNCSGHVHAGGERNRQAYILAMSMRRAQLKIADKLLMETPGHLPGIPVIAKVIRNEIALSRYIEK